MKRFCKKPKDHEILRVGGGTRFSLEFSGQSYMVFLHFSLAYLTESRSFGNGLKDIVSLHKFVVKLGQDC